MGDFNRDGGSRGGRRNGFGRGSKPFGGGRDFGGQNYGRGERRDRQMFKAVCSNCGKECEVPFKPTGDKPVYCSECFEKVSNRDGRRSFDRPRHDDRSYSDDKHKAQLESINAKLDKILSLLQPKEALEASSPSETAAEKPVKKTKTKPSKTKKASKEKVSRETE